MDGLRRTVLLAAVVVIGLATAYAGKQVDESHTLTDDVESRVKRDHDDAPDICKDATIDAITTTENGPVYIFKDRWYWRVDQYRRGVHRGFPRKIEIDWSGELPNKLDAALYAKYTRNTYFFKGSDVYKYYNQVLVIGYPQKISIEFPGVPSNIDGAYVGIDNCFYFIKGDSYYKYCYRQAESAKQLVSKYKGQPVQIDAAFNFWELRPENTVLYFFKGAQYYKINETTNAVADGYPRSTSTFWFRCDPNTGRPGSSASKNPKKNLSEIKSKLVNFLKI
ncbi:interstitial collagenase-like [Tubulanus polymorphus]|uniref:interstitial collagenase-like n=1 Tax=Tubulanus polymorphus TaxID=672921 RepID=UPI003DA62377